MITHESTSSENTNTHRTYHKKQRKNRNADKITEELLLSLSFEESSERLNFALEPGTSNFEVVSLRPGVFELSLEIAHLIDTLLSVTSGSHGVGFSLLDAGGVGMRAVGTI